LPFEFRHLGDNSVTEGFAFLLEHLIEPGVLRRSLGLCHGVDHLAGGAGSVPEPEPHAGRGLLRADAERAAIDSALSA